jgi:hypothetical protein
MSKLHNKRIVANNTIWPGKTDTVQRLKNIQDAIHTDIMKLYLASQNLCQQLPHSDIQFPVLIRNFCIKIPTSNQHLETIIIQLLRNIQIKHIIMTNIQ